ncbi:MAG: hypothetical protein NTV86_04440 [Planctomycetota bacterium]|nr:hypothetical protein [Planctomycetota bacterium]
MTTTQQHSLAPWRVFPSQDRPYRLEIVDDEGCTVAVLDASDEVGGAMEDDVTLHGDAAVMAAAPQLLAGFNTVLARLATEPMQDDELAQFCRDLITAAQGDAPTPTPTPAPSDSPVAAPCNLERVRNAEKAMTAFVKAKEPSARDLDSAIGQSLQEYLVDLLADLRHLAHHRGLDFDQADRVADGHFHAEVGGES